jgi:ATPases of the AAA+ class
MARFTKHGATFCVASNENLDIHDRLPGGNFVIEFNPVMGFYLTRIAPFELPKKVYGSLTRQRDRIINTFKDRELSTGILLAGEKGSGKSLLAKGISAKLADEGMPTLLVMSPYHGEDFSKFLQIIEQPSVVLFDEFEKTYGRGGDPDAQEGLLSLFDGIFPSKKLFMMTCNDKWRINDHMKNRPGRVYYFIEFHGLEKEFVEEYCEDNLRKTLHNQIPKLAALSSTFKAFNFDMLKAVVEEMNRYCEEPKDALALLNIKPDSFERQRYAVKLFIDGKEIPMKEILTRSIVTDPTQEGARFQIGFKFPVNDKKLAEIERQADNQITLGRLRTEGRGTFVEAAIRTAERRGLTFVTDDFVKSDAVNKALIFTKRPDGSHPNDIEDYLGDLDPLEIGDWKEATLWLVRVESASFEVHNPYEYL